MGKLFEKFGEFDSAAEINRAAAAQLAENDHDALRILAKENGIDEMDAQDYIDGMLPELCTIQTAAIGKLDVEVADLYKLPMTMQGWVDHIKTMVMDDPDFAAGVRQKGKSLIGLFARLIMAISKNRMNVPIDIVREARKLDSSLPNNLPVGDISKKEFRDIVTDYYKLPDTNPEPETSAEETEAPAEAAGEENTEVAPAQPGEPESLSKEPEETPEDPEDSPKDGGSLRIHDAGRR